MMIPNSKMIWLHLNGSIEVTNPGCPMQGVYCDILVEGVATYTPDEFRVTAENRVTDFLIIAAWDQRVAGGEATFTPSETEEEYWAEREQKIRKDVPHLSGAKVAAIIPIDAHDSADRYFRGAWTWATTDPVIDVDMPTALEIHKSKLRELRAPKLDALDVEYMRADEAGDAAQKAAIAAQKTALRDVTKDPALAAAKTPEELKAVLPEALK